MEAMWAVVEQLGHNQYAGLVSEATVCGVAMVRIDVPEVTERKEKDPDGSEYVVRKARLGYTKLIGAGSIFAITPCTEEVARRIAARMGNAESWNFTPLALPQRPALPAAVEEEEDEEENENAG